MKATLKEPEDKAIEGASKAAQGCGVIIAALIGLAVIGYSVWVLVSL